MNNFEKLKELYFTETQQGLFIGIPVGFEAVISGIEIINLLNEENEKDILSKDFPTNGKLSDSVNLDELRKLKYRYLSRATSYIITVCNLEGIISKSFLHFKGILRANGIVIDTLSDDRLIKDAQKEAMSDLYFYRHKVLAHTSFSDPRKDSSSLQLNSLAYFSGQLVSITANGFGLGTGGWHFDIKESERAPGFILRERHQTVLTHIDNWCSLFVELFDSFGCDRVQQCFKQIKLRETIA